jgi:hypothetical protein
MPFKFNLKNVSETGLDLIFYGQDHFDTISILDDRRDISQETIGDYIKNQKVLSNRHVLLRNLAKLIENLDDVENYIQQVLDKKLPGEPEIGRLINKCMGHFNAADLSQLEEMVHTNFKNALLTNSLSKLQMAQVQLAEKINSIFAKSLNNFLLH